MRLEKAIDLYLEKVKNERAEKTYKGYAGRLKKLRLWYGDKKIKELKRKHIAKWIDKAIRYSPPDPRAGQIMEGHTVRLTVVAWEQLQAFMLEKRIIKKPLFDYGKKPTGRKRTRIPTPLEQFNLFRLAMRKKRKEFALMFRCLRLCGARPGELCKANIEDYDREQRLIILKEHKTAEKTQEPRQIGVGIKMERLLHRVIGDRNEGPLFLDERGNRWKPEKVSRLYSKYRDLLGMSKEIVLYCSRHEHGTIVCEKIGIHAAQHSLGHRDITTTQRYVHPSPKRLPGYQDVL